MSGRSHSTSVRRRALDLIRDGASVTAAAREVDAHRNTVGAWARRAHLPAADARRQPRLRPAPERPSPPPPETTAARTVDEIVARLRAMGAAQPTPSPAPGPRRIPRSGCEHFRMGHRTLCTACYCAVMRGEAVLA